MRTLAAVLLAWLVGIPFVTFTVAGVLIALDRTCGYCGGSWAYWIRGRSACCRHCRKEIDRRIWALTATSTPTPARRDSRVR
jgi:hypothetical protein